MRDKQIEKLIKEEEKRQKSVINLIASENYGWWLLCWQGDCAGRVMRLTMKPGLRICPTLV